MYCPIVSISIVVRATTSIFTLLHPTLVHGNQHPTERNIATVFKGGHIRQEGMTLVPCYDGTLVQYFVITIVQVIGKRAPDGGNALQSLFLSHRSSSSFECKRMRHTYRTVQTQPLQPKLPQPQ